MFSFKACQMVIVSYLHLLLWTVGYHQNISSLKYHLLAEHTADAESPPPPFPIQKQTTVDSFQQRHLEKSTCNKPLNGLIKSVATACRVINIVYLILTSVKLESRLCLYY